MIDANINGSVRAEHVQHARSAEPGQLYNLRRVGIIVVVIIGYWFLSAVQTYYANYSVEQTLTQVLRVLEQHEERYGNYEYLDGSNRIPRLASVPGVTAIVPRAAASTHPGIVSVSTPPAQFAKMVTLFEESSSGTCWAVANVLSSQNSSYALFHIRHSKTSNYYIAIHGVNGCSWDDTEQVVEQAINWHTSWPNAW